MGKTLHILPSEYGWPLIVQKWIGDGPDLVDAAINQFDAVWAGFKCKNCGRKEFCPDPRR